jgi:hypothetical protein
MSAGRIVLLVFGILFVIVSFGLIVSGGVVLGVDNSFRDDQGFYSTGFVSLDSDSTASAITTRSADIQLEPSWFVRRNNPITIKVEGSSNDPTKQIFIGLARESDVRTYLNGVNYDEVSDFTFRPFHTQYIQHSGTAKPSPPTGQTFWVASATGSGTQTMQWNVVSGTYALVLMNADGSSPVDTSVSLAAKIPQIVHAVGLGLLIGGIVILVIGGVMIFFAVKGW